MTKTDIAQFIMLGYIACVGAVLALAFVAALIEETNRAISWVVRTIKEGRK
jgi:hypothetical protein